jgi:RHS repeat-associated protein
VTQTYDAMGAPKLVTPPGNGAGSPHVHELAYTPARRLASYVAPVTPPMLLASRTTTYAYDRDDLLTSVTSPVPALSPVLTRDLAGRVTRVTEGTRQREFAYAAGHVTAETVSGVPAGLGVTLTKEYGKSLLWKETQAVGGLSAHTLQRGYDLLGRPSALTLDTTTAGTLEYDADGLLTKIGPLVVERGVSVGLLKKLLGTPAGWEEAVSHDAYGAPTGSAATIAGNPKGGWSVTYDGAGRIATKTETPWGPGAPKVWAYTYDTSGRLATSELDASGPVAYTYDDNGNRATVDAQDRVTSQGGTTYAYNDHGNVTTRTVAGATQTLAWDSEGGLLSVTKPGAPTVDYALDARGRRVAKRVNGVVVREWLYDGQLRVVGEVLQAGGVTHTRAYGYVPERHLPVLMVDTAGAVTTTYRIYGDHLGSLRSVVDVATGAAVQTMEHGPWGEVLAESVTAGFERVPFGFAGGLYDDATGLVRFGAREYDPGTGRWLSKDEARFGGGWNFYEYAGGDPVNFVDKSGEKHEGMDHECGALPEGREKCECACLQKYDDARAACERNRPPPWKTKKEEDLYWKCAKDAQRKMDGKCLPQCADNESPTNGGPCSP